MNRHTPRVPGADIGFYPLMTAALLGVALGNWISESVGAGRGGWFVVMAAAVTACEIVLVQSMGWGRRYLARRQAAARRPGW